ncbi:MAG TPA: hypothetical protein VF585_01200 [Chthoniobacterales bacterium]|jgi:hypothetical protein
MLALKKLLLLGGVCVLGVAGSLLVSSCSRPVAQGEAPDLIILQTGRLRGNVVPEGVAGSGLQNYPYIAGYVKQVREEARRTKTPVLLVDLGDSLTGSFSSAVTQGANVATFFNELKYDAVMLGNLDAELTPETLKQLKMPVLCPFETVSGAPAIPGTQFSTTIQKPGLEVQLLTNFYGDTMLEEFPARFPSVFGAAEQVRPFRGYASLVQKLPAPNEKVVRLFGWMKFENDGAAAPPFLAELQKLAVNFVLAHRVYSREKMDAWVSTSTSAWSPPVSLNILRNNKGFALARADLKRVGGKWILQKQQILPMVSNTAAADDQVGRVLKSYASRIKAADAHVARAASAVGPEGVLDRYLAALASVRGTTTAVYSLESVRAGWPKGEIRTSDIFACLPWATGLVQFEITPEQCGELGKDSFFTLYSAPTLQATDMRTITTSDYLGRLIAKRLDLDRASFRSVVKTPEYVFFADYLRRMADPSINRHQPAGWKLHSAASP